MADDEEMYPPEEGIEDAGGSLPLPAHHVPGLQGHFYDLPTLLQSQRTQQPILGSEPDGAGSQHVLGVTAGSALSLPNNNPIQGTIAAENQPVLMDPSVLQAATMGANMACYFAPGPFLGQPVDPFPPLKHPSLHKPEHEDSKAKRRGPMDEMRQLVRIMVKFLPQSLRHLSAAEEPGGGNRVTEPQIKAYLKATLGNEAPQPQWGMPHGWGVYLSELFTWALGREITDEEARSCACRQQGRSWQVKETRLAELGIFAYAWPLPLTREGVRRAQLHPGDPPPGTNFLGPPPGWPNIELPYFKHKEARAMAAAAGADRPQLPMYTRAELDVFTERELLECVIPLLQAAQRRANVRLLSGQPYVDDIAQKWQQALSVCASISPPPLELTLAPVIHTDSANAVAAARDRVYSQLNPPVASPRRFPPPANLPPLMQANLPIPPLQRVGKVHKSSSQGKSLDALMDAVAQMRQQNGDMTASDSDGDPQSRMDRNGHVGSRKRKHRIPDPTHHEVEMEDVQRDPARSPNKRAARSNASTERTTSLNEVSDCGRSNSVSQARKDLVETMDRLGSGTGQDFASDEAHNRHDKGDITMASNEFRLTSVSQRKGSRARNLTNSMSYHSVPPELPHEPVTAQ